ncbi:MAG: M48 family metallopeptidase [Candidatus Methanomethylophilaceae archaeon]|nr:M48 family metallopeptidase [Candidatus Methanomethylophilaceae archaeon]
MERVPVAGEPLAVCRRHFPCAELHMEGRKEFFYSWRVTGSAKAEVTYSDYMADAPVDTVCSLVDHICRRARGHTGPEPADVTEYLRSDGFIVTNRPTYVSRSRNLLRTAVGTHHDLYDSVQRLLDSGLLEPSDVDNSYISWTRRGNTRRVGFCSTMFRVVGISSALDSPDIPDPVRDYVVYHECLHLRQGYRPGHRHHDAEFRVSERSFPGWRDAEAVLRGLGSR